MRRRFGRALTWPFRMLGRIGYRLVDFIGDVIDAVIP